jgi:hypothetical protein
MTAAAHRIRRTTTISQSHLVAQSTVLLHSISYSIQRQSILSAVLHSILIVRRVHRVRSKTKSDELDRSTTLVALRLLKMDPLSQIPGTNLYIGGLDNDLYSSPANHDPPTRAFSLRRKDALKDANITHVLSVIDYAMEKKHLEGYKHLHIDVHDVEDSNLLEQFKNTNAFIEEGLASGGGVFVHW